MLPHLFEIQPSDASAGKHLQLLFFTIPALNFPKDFHQQQHHTSRLRHFNYQQYFWAFSSTVHLQREQTEVAPTSKVPIAAELEAMAIKQ